MGKLVEHVVADEGFIHGINVVEKLFRHLLKPQHNTGETFQNAAAAQLFGVVDHSLKTKHAFAFAISLQGQLIEMKFENGEVIAWSLDSGFQSRRTSFSSLMRASFGAKDGF